MYPFYSKVYFLYFLEAKNPCFVTKICWKSSYICAFIFPKNGAIDFTKTFTSQEWLVVESQEWLPDPSLNHIFNVLPIGVQYTLSFQLTNFGLKYLIQFESRNKILSVRSYKKIMTSQLLFKNIFILRTSIVASFCWYHQNSNHFYQNNL